MPRAILAALLLVLCASPSSANSISLAGVIAPLIAKAQEIVGACGSTVISAFRRGARVAGTGHMSLHASGHAVDIRGNPVCIYGRLRNWSGGVSVDYASAPGGPHVHVSLGGREDGLRFVHRHGGHRIAHHRHGQHHRRYARA